MIGIFIQGVGLAMLTISIGLFRTVDYKKEFTLFGLSGVTLTAFGSVLPV